MAMDNNAALWATEEFGKADLGDKRRTARVVSMASQMSTHRAGKVTQVFDSGAEREGASGCVAHPPEVDTTPPGEKPVDWLLLTTHGVDTLEHAQLVVDGYSQRWKIEEVHKTWKSGGCQVEQSQLHTAQAAMKWSTLLFTVAIRTERIKYLARTSPDLPASVELSPIEIRALILLKRRQKKRTEIVPDTMPTIAQAARWLADLGGYTGKVLGWALR